MDSKVEDFRTRPGNVASGAFRDLEVVSLIEDVRVEEGVFPSGAQGTIVYVYTDAAAYEVEFETPQHGVVTLRQDQLTAA